MNLVIDIGNSRVKIAVFDGDEQVYVVQTENPDEAILNDVLRLYPVQKLIYSTVRGEEAFQFGKIDSHIQVLQFRHQLRLPVQNLYGSPDTLGLDRLAAVIGAHQRYPRHAVLVMDAGSCITFDVVDEEGRYFGGCISPGLKMRLQAMHHFTGKLPYVEPKEMKQDFEPVGHSTDEALWIGAVQGMIFEIEGYIVHFNRKYPQLKVILCGGDASFFDTRLKSSIFAHQITLEPHLVLAGLNTVVNDQHDSN